MSADHPYSTVRRVGPGRGYLSGVLPSRPDGTLAEEPEEAIDAVLATMRARLEAAGFTLADVVKATVFLTDMGWLPALNRAWAAAFDEPRPARSVRSGPSPGARIGGGDPRAHRRHRRVA